MARVASWFLFLCVFFCVTLCAQATETPEPPGEEDPDGLSLIEPAPLNLWGIEIATFRAPYRHFSPVSRVANTQERVRAIAGAPHYRIEFVPVIEEQYRGGWVMVNDERIIGLLTVDAPMGVGLEAYAEQVMHNLRQWLERRDAQARPKVLLFGLLYSALATACFVLLVFLLQRGRQRLLNWLEAHHNPKLAGGLIQVGGIQLMPYVMMLLTGIARLLLFGIIALFSYLWLTYVLRQFPFTKGFGHRLTDYIVGIASDIGLAILHSIPDLVMVVLIFWMASGVSEIVRNLFLRIERGRLRSPLFDPETAKATRRIIVVLVWLFSIVVAYPYIPGSDTEAFKGVSVFIGLIVSLGSAGIVSQVLGGLIVVYSRAFQPGEYVRIGEYEGTVTTVGVLSTKIKTIKKEEITIPNAVLLNATSTNYTRLSKPDGVIISTSVTIGYDTPWPQVHHLLLSAAAKTEGVRKTPEPQVRQTALSDWYVEYRLLVHIDDPEAQVTVLSELHQHIQDEFAGADLQIMSPHFMAQPDKPLVPMAWTPPAAKE